jgi:electron transfer flavoprotein beta subunit
VFFYIVGFCFCGSPAVEEAIRLRERLKDKVKSITVVTLGPPKAAETLRTALAMGADNGIHIEVPESAPAPEPLGVARALRAVIERRRTGGGAGGSGMETDLVIMGKQAIDDDLGQTGQMLAGLLGAAQATCASKLDVDVDARVARVRTEIDGGAAELLCTLPAVVTTDLRCVVRCARWFLASN